MKVAFYRPALRDLENIRTYIARDNPRAADAVIARIRHVATRLGDHPVMGRPGPRDTRLMSIPGLPYVLVYRLRSNTVAIVAVFHTARNRRF